MVMSGTRNLGERVEFRRRTEMGAPIIDGQLLRFLVDIEIRKAQRLRYCVSLVRIAADLAPPGTAPPSELPFAEMVASNIRSTDVVARWPSTSLTLLLLDADVTSLPSIVGRLTTELGIVWSAGGSCYPRTATGIEDLLRQAEDGMLKAQRDGGTRLYLPT
jgi:hypothetical protein